MKNDKFPASLRVEDLQRRHTHYDRCIDKWNKIDWLYSADLTDERVDRLLVRRPKEPTEMYLARKRLVTYTNIIGAGVAWYASKLWQNQPELTLLSNDAPVGLPDWYTEFIVNCDRNGTTLWDFFADVFLSIVQFQKAVVLIDNTPAEAALTLAEQDALGGRSPYLVSYDPRSLINWGTDRVGNLTWAMLEFDETVISDQFPHTSEARRTWMYFNDREYAKYSAKLDDRSQPKDAVLVEAGPHALSQQGRMPIQVFTCTSGLWLGNRVLLPALKHFNTENALDWALFSSALAILIITSKTPLSQNQTVSETGYLQLPDGAAATYLEQSGSTLSLLLDRTRELREETYRQMYLIQQGRSSAATPAAQSGYSKELDMASSTDILSEFGKIIKAAITLTVEAVISVRGEQFKARVSGLEFDASNRAGEMTILEQARRLAIPSDTLDKEISKQAARAILPNAPQEVIDQIITEIEASPTLEQRRKEEREQLLNSFNKRLDAAA